MRTAHRFRLLTAAAVTALGIAGSPLPASADTLAITSLDCQPRHGGFLCTGYVSGGTGTGTYSYLWSIGAMYSGPNSSKAATGCPAGSTAVRLIRFTVTDSSGASASQSASIDCSLTW